MPENFWSGNELRVTKEMPPDVTKRYAVTGKVNDFVSDNCDAGETVKTFWSPDFSVFLEPNEVEHGRAVQPVLIASVGPDSKIDWAVEGLVKIGCRDAKDADLKLLKFKRK